MSRPPHARTAVLDAFERILIDEGAQAATLDAVAKRAGVSKGGLLYHYASKAALSQAMLERADALAAEDAARMAASPDGPVAHFIRTSLMDGDDLDRAVVAVSRLAQAGDPDAAAALRRVRDAWEEALRPYTRDETSLAVVMLVGDGLYFNHVHGTQVIPGPVPVGTALDELIDFVTRVTSAD